MNSTDLWLRQLAASQSDETSAGRERVTAAAVRELWEELQRCAAIFNFHRRGERSIRVFLHADDAAEVVFARATARLTYHEGQLRLRLITVAAFAEQVQEQTQFSSQFSRLGLLYWQDPRGQKFSTDMLVRRIFEHLLQQAT